MVSLSRAALWVSVVTLVAFAPLPAAPVPAPVGADMRAREKLRGEWTLVRHIAADGTVRQHRGDNSTCDHFLLRFEDGKVVMEYDHGDPSLEIELCLALDASGIPGKMDLTVTEVPSSTIGYLKGKVRRGVYKLDGDRLVLCLADYGEAKRPAGFAPGEGRDVYELKRVKR